MKLPLSSLWSEFKAFAFKGNMIELAIAVVIGAAFSTVINSLVNDVIMPTVTYIVTTTTTVATKATDVAAKTVQEAADKTGLATTKPSTQASTQTTQTVAAESSAGGTGGAGEASGTGGGAAASDKPKEPVQIKWKIGPVDAGAFIGALLNFLLVAAAVFIVMVKLLGTVMQKVSKPVAPSEPVTKECPKCLSIIPIKATKCAHCTADLPAVT